MNVSSWVKHLDLSGFLDVAFMTLLIYTILVWSKRTRAAFVLTGILIVSGIYLMSRQFNLVLTAAIFEKFFAVIFIALVVIFQEELRYFFEQVAVQSLKRGLLVRDAVRLSREEVEILVRTLTDLARERVGALIVLRGRDLILRHLEGGIELNGRLSEPLLKSLFDPHSMGHDGAVIVEGDRIEQFSCQLPLSKNLQKIGQGGTRHAAALGLSERSDALCLVVSEERGTISIARDGDFTRVDRPEQLTEILEKFYRQLHPRREAGIGEGFIRRNWREKIIAVALALALWFVLVHGAKPTYKTFLLPVEHGELPEDLQVTAVSPPQVEVAFRGPRRAFYFLNRERIRLLIALENKKGVQRARIFSTNVRYPKSLVLESIDPREIKVKVEGAPPPADDTKEGG